MENSMRNKERLLGYLELIRDNQAVNPPEKMDRELLEETVNLLLKLQDKKVSLTPEEIQERVRKIPFADIPEVECAPQKRKKKINKKKILLLAAIITILCAFLCTVSVGFNLCDMHRILKEKFETVFNIPENTSQKRGNAEINCSSNYIEYLSVREFLENEDCDVLLPDNMPGGIEIESICVMKEKNGIVVSFDSYITSYNITLNASIPQNLKDNLEIFRKTDNTVYYLDRLQDKGIVQAYFEYGGDSYAIGCTDEQILLEILENLEE